MALGVDVEFDCPGFSSPCTITTGYYGDSAELQNQLTRLLHTGNGDVHFGSEYVHWSMAPVEKGSGDELLVEVVATTFIYVKRRRDFPWPQDVLKWLDRNDNPAGACLRLSFLTSRIAEPWLEDFRQQVIQLNDRLSRV